MGYLKQLRWAFLLTSALLPLTACASDRPWWEDEAPPAYSHSHEDPVSIEIVNDYGQRYNKHQPTDRYLTHRAYLEARKGEHYSIRVRNRTNKRIGIVIAVDGRNIISGKKSHLANNERMYVLGPHQSASYKGWRTGQDKVNRFYFTSAGDSYAAAWGDHSAMGVIAAAVYEEQDYYRPRRDYYERPAPRVLAPQAKRAPMAAADEATGTGYGRQEYSSSVRVEFKPKPGAAAKYFYKYEWRETLCKHNVIPCHPEYYHRNDNRFWPNDWRGNGPYAPPPPR